MLLWVFIFVIIPLGFVSYRIYEYGKKIITDQIYSNLEIEADNGKTQLLLFIENKKSRTLDFSISSTLQNCLREVNNNNRDYSEDINNLRQNLVKKKIPIDPDIYDILIFDSKGNIVLVTDEAHISSKEIEPEYFLEGKKGISVEPIEDVSAIRHFSISAPVTDSYTHQFLGVITVRFKAERMDSMLTGDSPVLGNADITINKNLHKGDNIFILNKNLTVVAGDPELLSKKINIAPLTRSYTSRKNYVGEFTGINGKKFLCASSFVAETEGLIVVSVVKDEALRPLRELFLKVFPLTTATGIMVILLTLVLAKNISTPIIDMVNTTERITNGNWNEMVTVKEKNGEIVRLANSVNMMIKTLHNSFQNLAESEERLQSIINNSPAIIFVKDINGHYIMINRQFEDFFHLDNKNIKGKTDYDFFPKDTADKLKENDRTVIETGVPLEMEETVPQDDIIHTYISVKFPLLDTSGNTYAVCGISTDITERKKLEEQLRQTQKMESIGLLAGGVAHDFNNILTGMTGYADLLSRQIPEVPKAQRYLEEIKKSITRATGLTRQLLAFSRKQTLQPTIVNINSLIDNTSKMLQRLIGEDIDLKFIPTPDLGNARADIGQMEQVLMNLAVNARDAMPNGGKLTIETANVNIDKEYVNSHPGAKSGPHIMMALSDTGCGMDEQTQKRIFEPFFTTKESGKGTGLGLATVYGIVKQHGGSIYVYSEKNKGTTFKIYIPRVEEAVKETKTKNDEMELPRGNETILVAEDDDAVRNLVKMILSELGYNVLCASDPSEAENIFKENKDQIKLLLTDMIMPGCNGEELYEKLKAQKPSLKKILMSGYTDKGIIRNGIIKGNIPFIQKPFTTASLALKVRAILDVK
ncbi:MAG: PAS domain-containing protein [Candidatus Schekmanbacteria bacterium]|nr:PAS domain-containing protein [Candidatus Schekmanbacteria bacterium]